LKTRKRQVGCSYIAVALIEVDVPSRHFTHNRVSTCGPAIDLTSRGTLTDPNRGFWALLLFS